MHKIYAGLMQLVNRTVNSKKKNEFHETFNTLND